MSRVWLASIRAQAELEVKSREDAIENGKLFLRVMGSGECEMLQLVDAPPKA